MGHGSSWDAPSPREKQRMTRAVRFRPQASEDVDSAISWYGDERPALAFAFAESLDTVVARISETPFQFPVVHGETRRALLGRFPYAVFFIVDADVVHVLAVVHLHRDPSAWKSRD